MSRKVAALASRKASTALVRTGAATATASSSRVEIHVSSIEIELSEPMPAEHVGHVLGSLLSPLLSRMFPGMPLPPPIVVEEEKPREVPAVVESSRIIEEEESKP